MKLLIDVQLPVALNNWFIRQGFDCVHALDLRMGQSDDRSLWDYAESVGRVMISKDADFFILASRPNDHGKLIWIRLGNCRTRPLIAFMERHWPEISDALQQGQRIIEIR